MAYQVIARKWRPKSFQELVGQEHISQTLLNALRGSRLHHALLFTGPRGTGKTSSARILAKALRCPNAKEFDPCNICSECEEIASGRSINVIEIDGASNNGVDAVRELRDTVAYQPSSGRYKLYIIDEVHMLSTSAFNALLKTLEEPPAHVIFVLATTEVHKIPETVLSRCQRFDFRCIPLRAITEHLEAICRAEGVEFEPEALWTIARQGAGSMRDSQSYLDQAITFAGGKLTQNKVIEILGLTDRRLLVDALSAILAHATRDVLDVATRVFHGGYEPRLFMQDLLQELRNLLMLKILSSGAKQGDAQQVVELPESDVLRLKELGASLSEEDIHLLFDMALKGANDLVRAPDTRVVLEMILLRMASAPRLTSLLSLVNESVSVQTASASVTPRTAPVAPTASHPPAAPPQPASPAAQSPSEQRWLDLVTKINAVNPVIGAQLENCYLQSLEGAKVTLGVSAKMKFLITKLNDAEFKKKVLNYITTFWGPGFQLEVVASDADPAASPTPRALTQKKVENDQQKLREQIAEHPLVKTTQALFKSEIRSIKETKS